MKSEGKYRGVVYMGVLAFLVLLLAAGAPALAQETKPEGSQASGSSQQAAQQKEPESGQQKAQQRQTQTDQQQAQQKEKKSQYQTQRQQAGQTEELRQYKPIVGREVRSSGGDDIGEVDNIVVSEDGQQIQAVVSMGGFLGMGQKKVLVSFDELQFQPASDIVVYRGTEQDLERLAEYEEPEDRRRFAGRPPYYPAERRGYDWGAYPPGDRYGYGYPPPQEDRFGRGYYEYEGRQERYPYRDDRFGGRYDDRFREDDRYGRGYDPQREDGRFYPRRDERSDRGSMMMRDRGSMMRDQDSSSRTYGERFEGREDGRYFPPREGRYDDRRYDERYGRQ